MKRTIMNGVYCEICGKEHIHDSDGFKTSELDYFVVKDDSGELMPQQASFSNRRLSDFRTRKYLIHE